MKTYNKVSEYPVLNSDYLKPGFFVVIKRPEKSGFLYNQIEKAQLKAGYSKAASKYVHVSIIGVDCYIINTTPPRTKIADLFEVYKGRYIKILKYKEYKENDLKGYEVAFWAASTCNIRYDWIGLAAFKFPWLGKIFKRLQKKWLFCSECAIWALQKVFPVIKEKFNFKASKRTKPNKMFFGDIRISPEKCMPGYFLNNKDFPVIWEGEI